jgi:uncharacterized protein YyaL (SSP411 family)
MERESFENPSIAALMNEHFVNIKVDREERPDIDQIYMKAVQAMTGSGGWPMTVFLTPDGIPFFGGTYYPPEARHGLPGFPQVLEGVAAAYRDRAEEVVTSGTRLLELLRRTMAAGAPGPVGAETLDGVARTLAEQYDTVHGGFGRAPKFPQPVTLEFLLAQHERARDPNSLSMTLHTLRCMAAGGMRDHLGGGFHRYSVDERWLVPHFEKMLYDNALLASAYLHAYRVSDSDDLAEVVTAILDDVLRDLTLPEGGFTSARDADSEGEEGVFYLWSIEEVEEVLGADRAATFAAAYGITPGGNFEGRTILHRSRAWNEIAQTTGLGQSELERQLERDREALRRHREQREAPFRDDKVIASWNGFMIRAFAEAGATLDRPEYVAAAVRAAEFVDTRLRRDGRLLHSVLGEEAGAESFLEDHGALGNAYLALHAATLDVRWLEAAEEECRQILRGFRDEESGVLFDTAGSAEGLVLRPRDPMDNATPSGTSLAAELLLRTGRLLAKEEYVAAAIGIVEGEAEYIERFGPAFGRLLSVAEAALSPSTEIVIVGADVEATAALVRTAHRHAPVHAVIAGRHLDGTSEDSAKRYALFADRDAVDGAAAAYVCRDHACLMPVTTPEALATELRAVSA